MRFVLFALASVVSALVVSSLPLAMGAATIAFLVTLLIIAVAAVAASWPSVRHPHGRVTKTEIAILGSWLALTLLALGGIVF